MDVLPTFSILAVRLPVMLIWLAAIVFSIATWKKHAQVSLLILVAMILLFVEALAGGFVSYWIPMTLFGQRQVDSEQIGLLVSAIGLTQSLLSAIAWGLVIVAAFGWRRSVHEQTESVA